MHGAFVLFQGVKRPKIAFSIPMVSFALAASLAFGFREPFHRLVQILPTVHYNSALQERSIDEAARLGRGITFSFGPTDGAGVFAQARFPQWRYFDPVMDRAIQKRLPKIRIKIGGGPPIHPTWQALNGNKPWSQPYRPPKGLWKRLTEYKQQVIDRAFNKVKAAGLDPKDVLEIELATEPGKGGSGGPWSSASPYTYEAPYNVLPEGHWDKEFHEHLSYECSNLDFKGLPVLSPSFEYQSKELFDEEMKTFSAPEGAAWRSKVTHWVVNIYVEGEANHSVRDVLITFRTKAMRARNLMWSNLAIGDTAKISVGEFGLTPRTLKRSGSEQDEKFRGEVLRACEDSLPGLGYVSSSLYTLVDDDFGLFDKAFRAKPALETYAPSRITQ